MKDGFWLIWLAVLNTCHSPLAVSDSPFSTYFIGACIQISPQGLSRVWRVPDTPLSSHQGVMNGPPAGGTESHGNEKISCFRPLSSERALSGTRRVMSAGGWL